MNKSIRRVTVIQSDAQGEASEVYNNSTGKRKKGSMLLRPIERITRRFHKAHKAYADEVYALHDKHSRKRRDGWLFDSLVIVRKANRKAIKTLLRV